MRMALCSARSRLRCLFALGIALSASVPATSGQAQAVRRAPGSLAQLGAELEDLARRVGPSVVQVLATGYATSGSEGAAVLAKQRGTGSGVIVDPEGYIVTNAHVVLGARRIQVILPSPGAASQSILRPRGRTLPAEVVGIDAETDLAVLRVEEKGLPALGFGDSEALRQGQLVLAFGSPLGFDNTATLGIVSSVARQLKPESPMIYVQTDAPINPGNSGGPLVDVEGRVVGINTLIASQGGGNEGLGFSAPSNIVRNVYEQIRSTGHVRRGEIGVRVQTITPALAGGLGLPRSEGVMVTDVEPLSGADLVGLKLGDVVLSLDGKAMENARQFEVNLYRRTPGESVTLAVQRGPRTLEVSPHVSERAHDPGALRLRVTPEANLVPRLGLLALDLTDEVRRLVGPRSRNGGVAVAATTPDGPAWPDPPRPGDLIQGLNRESVSSVEDLRALVAALKPGDPVALIVEREEGIVLLAAELE